MSKRTIWQFSALGTLHECVGQQPEVAKKGNRNMSESWAKHMIKPRFRGAGQTSAPSPRGLEIGLPFRVLGVMVMTTALTFATLTTGYEIFFSHSVFA